MVIYQVFKALNVKAASNEDFPLKSKFGGNIGDSDVFFIYDDRGCEVIACEANLIRPVYEKYYGWVEEVDKKGLNKG